MKRLLFLFAILTCFSGSISAQSTNAALSGTVTDVAQAIVPGATVTVENTLTGVALTATANESGVYNFPSLQPGKYRVTAEKAGFKRTVYTEVTLELSDRVTLNFSLEVGAITTDAVEINAAVDTRLAIGNNSVGGVISGQKVLDLPLPNRDALGLVLTQAGLVGDNFSGARIGTLNISRDGVNVQDQRINLGVASTIFTSVDLVQELRIVTSPADAEFGRGSGQIQMITRSGTNDFRGSVFESHRNTALNANTWFNNQRGRDPITGKEISPRNVLIRNQFGGRLGGPIIKNKLFFHVNYEGQRIATKNAVTTTVFTQSARQGNFRFFPGVRNGNAIAAVPTVDLQGNPVKPSTATGDLQTVNLFGRDTNRAAINSISQQFIGKTPLPNNFQVGDGLNTAGFTWQRAGSSDFDHLSVRSDYSLSEKHQLSFSFTRETGSALNGFMAQNFPDTPGGNNEQRDYFYSIQLVSTLSPTLVNEFRYGALRPWLRFNAPWEVAGIDSLPKVGNQPYVVDFVSITDPLNITNDPQGRISPSYQFFDSITWQRGRHAFKGGAEMRFVSTNGFNSFDVMPRAVIGSGGAAVQNITNITGIGLNAGTAVNILNDLSGSLSSLRQAFNSPGGQNPVFLSGEGKQRTWQQREFSWFFKDDFKIRPNLTLNLGVRYEWYGVPYDANGKTVSLVGGSSSIFGITGNTLADLFQPGSQKGTLTTLEQVGKNSINPDRPLYNNDNNNFAPALGFSWAPNFLGENKTVIRAGYGIGYERNSLRLLDVLAGDQPGLRSVRTFTQSAFMGLGNPPFPLTPLGSPLSLVPLDDRTQTVRVYDTNLRTPYVQNWNVSVSRSISKDMVIEARYVGNKGTRLIRGFDVNEVNIFASSNGETILDAFRAIQTGGESALLDRLFNGLNLGSGVVNGSTIRAGAGLRNNANTRDFFAFNNVGGFANYLSGTDNFTNVRGGLLRRANLPENFILANPQFASARLTTNSASSTYHSFQLDFTKRFSRGWTVQSNYTFAKALGEEEGAGQEMVDSYRTLRNLRLDKRRMSFDIRHVVRNSGTFELPFGPGRKFLNSSNGIISRLVGRWQIGGIFNIFSGDPLTIGAARSSLNQFTDGTPILVGNFPKNTGNSVVSADGVRYFTGLQQVNDPSIANITTSQGLQARSTMLAIADSSGKLLLVNPTPGLLGTLAPSYIEGPGSFRLDLNVLKRVKIKERVDFQFTANFIDALNTPIWGNPNTDINSVNFGRITDAGGNRIIVLEARISF